MEMLTDLLIDGVELIGPSKTYVFTHKDQSLEEKQFIAGVTDAVKKILGADNPPIGSLIQLPIVRL